MEAQRRSRAGRAVEESKKDKTSKADTKGAASLEEQPQSDKGPASQEGDKEESLEELRSSVSDVVIQEVLETSLSALDGMEALACLSQGSDDEVDEKMKRFLVEITKVCCLPPVPVKEVENYMRSEVAAKRATMKSRAVRTTGQTVRTERTQEGEEQGSEEQDEAEQERGNLKPHWTGQRGNAEKPGTVGAR